MNITFQINKYYTCHRFDANQKITSLFSGKCGYRVNGFVQTNSLWSFYTGQLVASVRLCGYRYLFIYIYRCRIFFTQIHDQERDVIVLKTNFVIETMEDSELMPFKYT